MKLVYNLILALFLRFLLVVYGEWQDNNFNVSYTDIDYHVFTDASRYMSSGESPYRRSTYRYPPILAALLLPNIWLHRCYGKVLFAVCDVIAGGLGVMLSGCSPPSKITLFLCLYNPLNAIISTRGSADSISSAMVISSVMAITRGYVVTAGIILALAAHLRVYPILFFLPMWLSLLKGDKNRGMLEEFRLSGKVWFKYIFTLVTDLKGCYFMTAFACALGILTSISYAVYGNEFLQESYLYHFSRVDIRHNFSVHFYMFLLGGNILPSLIVFLPQLLIIVMFGLKYGNREDLPFACFCQVYIFVVFNKVVTAQYFMWPLSIFPIIMPKLMQNQDLSANRIMHFSIFNKFVLGVAKWSLAVALWLYTAYCLEFLGHNTFFLIWICGLLLFGVHVCIIKQLIRCYDVNRIKGGIHIEKLN
ncbi:GPI mannosyltransferase 1 [Ischnura elegans]|uniref:GPI mannosyltransferase 1 n=1 Tax=Ischnura elegans TaxID=197161 RepID=UPI001ED8AA1D|nr:GPI mannosyltransferase 1 [Ischnura elegans]